MKRLNRCEAAEDIYEVNVLAFTLVTKVGKDGNEILIIPPN